MIFENYACNCLKILTKNTAITTGGGYVEKSYFDIINKIEGPKKKQKNSTQIISDVMAKGGLKFNKKRKGG